MHLHLHGMHWCNRVFMHLWMGMLFIYLWHVFIFEEHAFHWGGGGGEMGRGTCGMGTCGMGACGMGTCGMGACGVGTCGMVRVVCNDSVALLLQSERGSALHEAALSGKVDTVKLLLDKGEVIGV